MQLLYNQSVMKPNTIFRKATPDDFDGILRLQHKNLLANLKEEDLSQGFLTIEYTREQLQSINSELGIYISCNGEEVIGYLMAQSNEFAVSSPLIASLRSSVKDISFDGAPLSSRKSFFYGPVCIDSEHRGQGILEELFKVMLQGLQGRCDVGLAFVSAKNPRSYHVHKNKLGMSMIDEFEFNGLKFRTLIFLVK